MSIIEKAISKLERAAGNKRTDRVRSQKIQRMTVDAGNTLSKENDVTPNKQSSFIDSVPESVNVEPRNYVVIDLKRLNQLGIVTPDQGKTQIAEQFRIIKRPLLTKAFSKKNNNLITYY